ncbi:VanZ family protein [Microbacterium sp. EYE_5]|uniref:VanZ family protein n=1 Tax=unclassified Microbacterium TaxID=2609290 RepID=UPI0020066BCD|nr:MULTISPECIES: VanZ family protein [unclassified Microbacterium]MCK6079664.1 VanZ family protein [Microbacterium sp. EYE_382]MCK6084935.1 VanZ family protein [Microbacterium sp. EYE_384]MCK6122839.1 VanZ family protein [Microbacterium sp. EYE_80]MCK6125698.1 VanZ family protein [Microbacterium sp. EYE_79]MCK6140619.1 VanZ family protein [Microbacterium sp. EYE_39]
MAAQLYSALMAVLFGVILGVLLFVPLVAVSYRRRGRLTLPRLAFWAASLVYFVAIWTYTLLPIPSSSDYRCAGAVLTLRPTIDDIAGAIADGSPLTDVRLLQVAFNVLLFVPLGFLVRVVGRRGVLIGAATGLAVSLVVEFTQLTGVWGVFPCAYRLFDVGDLTTNVTGAIVGSLLGLFVPGRLRGVERAADADEPRPVTRWRRLLAIVCDVLGASILAAAAGAAVQLILQFVLGRRDLVEDGTWGDLAAAWVPIAVWLAVILTSGRSVGDLAVELRFAGGRMPEVPARLLRFAGGIGGYLLVAQLFGDAGIAAGAFGLLAVVLFFTTQAGRGLPGVLSGRELIDARATSPAASARGH